METARHKEGDTVIVSGSLTGLGDLTGRISEVEYDKISNQYFYVVQTSEGGQHLAQERFVSTPGK